MKYLKKLIKAERRENEARNKYIQSKLKSDKMAKKLTDEYYKESHEREEAFMYIQTYSLDVETHEDIAEEGPDGAEAPRIKQRDFGDELVDSDPAEEVMADDSEEKNK